MPSTESPTPARPTHPHHLRFLAPHLHLHSVFGGDWFALKAEAFEEGLVCAVGHGHASFARRLAR